MLLFIQQQQQQLSSVLQQRDLELKDREFLLEVERLNNPKRLEEAAHKKEALSHYRRQVD